MNFFQTIQERILRYFVHPLYSKKPISYKETLHKIHHILVLCSEVNLLNRVHKKLSALFPNARITIIIPLRKGESAVTQPLNMPVICIEQNSLLKILRNVQYIELKKQTFDLLLDFNTEPGLLSMLCCRSFHPTICFGFNKPFGQHYYNFQYGANPNLSRDKQLDSIFKFLQAFISGKRLSIK